MTRKITASCYMTIDGRGAFPKYLGSDRPPTNEPNEFWREFWFNRFDDVTTVIMGRRSFLGHRRVWSEKSRKKGDPQFMWDYSRFMDKVEKVCLSHRLKSTDWENTRIMKGDLSKIVAKLKKERGGNIIVEGGPRLVQEFMRQRLADDYLMLMQPVVFGQGPRYWGPMDEQLTLKILSSKVLEDGEVLLRYETVRKKLTKKDLLGS
ncbi:MAG: dihydrofolate reductase family protein [Thermoplasmata archaeon]|jgi:dihydrofolate reductase